MPRLTKAQRKQRKLEDLTEAMIDQLAASLAVMEPCTRATDVRYIMEAYSRLMGLTSHLRPEPDPSAPATPTPSTPDHTALQSALSALLPPSDKTDKAD